MSVLRIARSVLALGLALFAALGCDESKIETDRFVEALVASSAKSSPEALFQPLTGSSYSVVVMPGPGLDQEVLKSVGIEGAGLQTIASAAPKDFKAVVVFFSENRVLMGWFLGNYFEVTNAMRIKKLGGQPVKIALKYGGALPQITSLE